MIKTRAPLGVAFAWFAVGTACASVHEHPGPHARVDLAAFDEVWQTVDKHRFDPNFDHGAWTRAKTTLRPAVQTATSSEVARRVIHDLIRRLDRSHYALIPKEAYVDDAERPKGDIGVTVRALGEALVVMAVRPGSPADQAGVKAGWRLVEANGRPAAEIFSTARKAAGIVRPESSVCAVARSAMAKPVGRRSALSFLDRAGRPRHLDITAAAPAGHEVTVLDLPPVHVRSTKRLLRDDIAYYAVNYLLDPVWLTEDFGAFIQAHRSRRGLVLDLRGNPGGQGSLATALAGWLVAEPDRYLGTVHLQGGTLPLVISNRLETYDGPIAVLVDECTASTAEIMADGLQAIGRARVMGQRTAGLVLSAMTRPLANGDVFMFAVAGYTSAGGYALEGRGVQPDQPIAVSVDDFNASEDPVLAEAIVWLESQSDAVSGGHR